MQDDLKDLPPAPKKFNVRQDEPAPYYYESGLLQHSVNVPIPLVSVVGMRRVAEELRGLATRLEYLAAFPVEDDGYKTLWQMQWLVRRAALRLQGIKRRGRPPKARSYERPRRRKM